MSVKYHAYLKSPEWAAKRLWALERAGHHCQVCRAEDGLDGSLDVHHNTYETLGHEGSEDLAVLCRECHELFHANQKKLKDLRNTLLALEELEAFARKDKADRGSLKRLGIEPRGATA